MRRKDRMRRSGGFLLLFVCFLCAVLLQGCTSSRPALQRTTLSEIYPGDITKVDRVELLDGTKGRTKWLDDPVEIRLWIGGLKDVVLIPEENQEGSVGGMYVIGFYEGEERKLWFSPQSIEDVYYETNELFTGQIRLLFEREFKGG